MKIYCLILLFAFTSKLFSQKQADTSYTVYATYKKEIKHFPNIKIAEKKFPTSITAAYNVLYSSVGHRPLAMDVFSKKSDGKLPGVLLIHGGGWKSGNKSQMHLMAQQIAAAGYNCFCIEYRLSPEAQYPAGINDVKEAIAHIKANAVKYNTDINKLAVAGYSSGGQMAALIGTTCTNDIQAIIDMDGILAFHHPESAEGKVAAEWLGGTYSEKPEVWDEASALSHTGKNTPPILFINSSKPRFHAGRDDMTAILDKYNIYHETHTFENSPHSFWFFDPWFDDMVNYSITFLDTVFKKQ